MALPPIPPGTYNAPNLHNFKDDQLKILQQYLKDPCNLEKAHNLEAAYANAAYYWARSQYPDPNDPIWANPDGQDNAIRHAFVSAVTAAQCYFAGMSVDVASDVAMNLGMAIETWEVGHDPSADPMNPVGPHWDDSRDDLINDDAGIQIFKNVLAEQGSDMNAQDLLNAVMADVFNPGGPMLTAINPALDKSNRACPWMPDLLDNVKFFKDGKCWFVDPITSAINKIKSSLPFKAADPLIIDLNGSGVKTTSINDGIFLDINNDGIWTKTAWADPNDGVLILQGNTTPTGANVLGQQFQLPDGSKALSGFDALASLDSNNDGIINAQDAEFNQLAVLKSDGTIISLETLGIQSINVGSTATNVVDSNGNTQLAAGTFTTTNGATGQIADYSLNYDPSDTVQVTPRSRE